MKTALLSTLLTSPIKETPGHFLYSIRDEDTMFYIGQSLHPTKRIRHHLTIKGINEIGTLGKLVFCNLPSSLTWQVHLYSLADCEPFVASYYHSEVFSDTPSIQAQWIRKFRHVAGRPAREQFYNFSSSFGTSYISEAEAALIWHWKPCCNVVFNSEQSPYPPTVVHPQEYFHHFPEAAAARTFLLQQLTRQQTERNIA